MLAALGFVRLEVRSVPDPTAVRALKTWLGSWRSVGLAAEAMRARQDECVCIRDVSASGLLGRTS